MKKIGLVFFTLFIVTTLLYLFGITNTIDSKVFDFILSIRNTCLTNIMKCITFLGSTKFVIVLLVIITVLYNNIKIYILDLLMALEIILNLLIKFIIKRPRPELINLVVENTYSYPSGHVMSSVILYGFIAYLIKKTIKDNKIKNIFYLVLFLLPLLIFISRIYLGIHHFIDCLGGLFLGLSILFISLYIIERKKI